MKTLPESVNLQAAIEGDGLRVEISRGMRAPIVNGQPTLQPCFRADCFIRDGKRWKPFITLVDDTASGVLEQLAKLSTEGEVSIR